VAEGDDRLREQPVLSVDEVGSAVVVRLGGELDLYNADPVRTALAAAIDREPSRLVVDIAQVEFMDSTALSVLIEARRRLKGPQFRLAAPQEGTRRTLEVSGLDRHLNVHATVDEALTAE
jgi:anti-sigma B factor antagonist